MTDPRQVERIFERALDLDPDERDELLDEACGEDAVLRRRIEALLAADAEAEVGGVLDPPSVDEPGPEAGSALGPWRLLRLLGTGGMGRVYLAERADGAYDRTVAVKLIRAGLDTAFMLRRFERERRVLAALEHPNIAGLIDGGVSEDGVPFLVMEYVEGTPIDRYCDREMLSLRDRLKLFREVCDAVQHAHRNLVVHRDIKPSNILVRDDGSVKLLDFGIAKVLDSDPGEVPTETGLRAMTPRYASPEQVLDGNVTTATDVYSLGVVLFELISGGRPFEIEDLSPAKLERVVTGTAPRRPSDAVGASAVARREGGPPALAKRLRGDLDNIVLTAIRKEPERRYGSAEQLSEDVRRYLERFPVKARPDTLVYRLTKFASRNRAAILAGVAIAVALIAGTTVSVHFALREAEQRRLADARFRQVRDLANTFLDDVDRAISTRGRTAARASIVSTGLRYLERLSREAREDPQVLADVARGYFLVARIQGDPKAASLGDVEAAFVSARKGREAAERLSRVDPGSLPSRLIEVEAHLLEGDLARHEGPGRIVRHLEEALAARRRIADAFPDAELAEPRLDTVYFRMGYALERAELFEPSIEHLLRAQEIGQALIERYPDKPNLFRSLAVTLNALCQSYRFAGRPEKALELLPPLRERLVVEAERHPELRPTLANLRYNLGWAYVHDGQVDRGVREISAVEAFYRVLAENDPDDVTAWRNTASARHDLADLAVQQGMPERALEHLEELVRLRRAILARAPESALFRSDLATGLTALADALHEAGESNRSAALRAEAAAL